MARARRRRQGAPPGGKGDRGARPGLVFLPKRMVELGPGARHGSVKHSPEGSRIRDRAEVHVHDQEQAAAHRGAVVDEAHPVPDTAGDRTPAQDAPG